MNPVPSSSYSPPPYVKPNHDTEITQVASSSDSVDIHQHPRPHHRHHHPRLCRICKRKHTLPSVRNIGPYLMDRTQPDLITICPCAHRAHPICLKKYGTDYACNVCNYIYNSRKKIHFFAQFLCLVCHLLSLASAVGLVFGLSQLGKALDEIGLGSEYGPKLDGDETWQDHEMAQIVAWLNIVHLTTGFAGEALLGLVYIVGVCLVVGVDKALIMVSNILYVRLHWHQKHIPDWLNRTGICVFLFLLGLLLGTYLLFFSWIWASVLHYVRKRVLNVNSIKLNHHEKTPHQGLPIHASVP